MPTKKKTAPEVEEKLDENVEKITEEKIRADDILTVEARDVVETDEDRENSIWFELRNAHRARRILTGRMDAMERTPNGDHLVVVYYKDFRVVIPYEEMNINLNDDPDLGDINVRRVVIFMLVVWFVFHTSIISDKSENFRKTLKKKLHLNPDKPIVNSLFTKDNKKQKNKRQV